MKQMNLLTLRFVSYFTLFYVAIILAFFITLVIVFGYENRKHSSDILLLEPFEVTDKLEQKNDGTWTFSEGFERQARDNDGELYLMTPSLTLLTTTDEACALCEADFTQLSNRKLKRWDVDDNIVYFVANDPFEGQQQAMVQAVLSNQFSAELQQTLERTNTTVEHYKEGERVAFIGEQLSLLRPADFVPTQLLTFEHKENRDIITQDDGSVIVLRSPNERYRTFDQLMADISKMGLVVFIVVHILLLIGVIIMSLVISSRFVRPVRYILSRIERLAQFDYAKPSKNPLYKAKTKRLKRKYNLYQPVDESLNNLSTRLAYNERQIKNSEKLREEWITGLSHDLKTPLSSIFGYSAMLNSDYEWSQTEVRQFAATMQEKATYMDALIKDLTYTYQLKNKAVTLTREIIDLTEWLQQFSDEDVEVEVTAPAVIEADKLLMQRVLDNIITNAKKHTPVNTRVLVRAMNTTITVQDFGTGIPQEELDNLFERYYRGTNTTSNSSGTGLGLAITKQLVELHGGTITVSSNDTGTIFTIDIPKNHDR